MRIQGITINAGNTLTLVESGIVSSGVHGNAGGECHLFITDIICPNATVISTNAGAGASQLIEMAAGSHRFDPPLACPAGAGVYTNAYDVTMTYYLKDTKTKQGAYGASNAL